MWRTLPAAGLAVFICVHAAGVAAAPQQTDVAALQDHAKAGERALAEGRYAEAEKEYRILSQLSPGMAEVHVRLGLIYFQQGKFTEAIPTLREALRLKPGFLEAQSNLGLALTEQQRYGEAEQERYDEEPRLVPPLGSRSLRRSYRT